MIQSHASVKKKAPIRQNGSSGGKQPHRPHRTSSTPSTPSTVAAGVEAVEGVEGLSLKPDYQWQMEAGLDRNFSQVGTLLGSLELPLYQHPDGGLVFVDEGRPRRIATAKELAPLLIDHVRIAVTKSGKYHGESVAQTTLNHMLMARTFLNKFPKSEEVVTTPVILPDMSPSHPGFNPQGGIVYLGEAVVIGKGIDTINRFLDVMEWQGDADRTNAVAAALSVPFRRQFPGGKPFVLVSASKSHAGKGTVTEFVRGKTAKAEILYEDKDWPMQKNLFEQLLHKPEIGIINLDNVRTDSSGRARFIRSGFVESFITNAEVILTSATSRKPIRTANKFVVLLNTNEGSLSIDLLNRSLPIRLDPSGDLSDRIVRAKSLLGGDVKHEWLPAHQSQIEAELWGMIDRWIKEGKPLDESIHHPMGPWAATIGGILQVNGFKDFLSNYSATRSAADPIREAISILAFYAEGKPKRARDLAQLAVSQGLHKTLLVGVDSTNTAASERQIGVMLSPYVGESFTAVTLGKRLTYRLKKEQGRWNEEFPHYRYTFDQIAQEAITEEAQGGLVLEECAAKTDFFEPDLVQFQPRTDLP